MPKTIIDRVEYDLDEPQLGMSITSKKVYDSYLVCHCISEKQAKEVVSLLEGRGIFEIQVDRMSCIYRIYQLVEHIKVTEIYDAP